MVWSRESFVVRAVNGNFKCLDFAPRLHVLWSQTLSIAHSLSVFDANTYVDVEQLFWAYDSHGDTLTFPHNPNTTHSPYK